MNQILPPDADACLILNASLPDGRWADVRVQDGRIRAIAPSLSAGAGEPRWNANGGCLLPALRDHHLHLYASAARRSSLDCAQLPPARDALIQAIRDWPQARVRMIHYDPAVAGELDRQILDQWCPDRPLRVAHLSGRLWYANSAAIAELGDDGPWERGADGQLSGRLWDADDWLRSRHGHRLSLDQISQQLAAWGVVGLTDTSPGNDSAALQSFRHARQSGECLQELMVMGNEDLHEAYAQQAEEDDGLRIAHLKIHLLESRLPDFDDLVDRIRRSHAHNRPIAVHCVSRSELVFCLAALRLAGCHPQDRIEHAGVCPPEAAAEIRALNLTVVTQPVFIHDRGDRYLRDVAVDDQPWLYRLAGLQQQGIALAGSSDSPYGDLNPWRAMAAAVNRQTRAGIVIGAEEAMSPEQALRLYTGPLPSPASGRIELAVGELADLCLLDRPWSEARLQLDKIRVQACWHRGRALYFQA